MVEFPTVNGRATWRTRYASGKLTLRVCIVTLAILLVGIACGEAARALANDGQEEHVTTLRGRVLNAVTNEPVPRALVVLRMNDAATFTDDRGQFELNISEKIDTNNPQPGSTTWMSRVLETRKPGFIQAHPMVTIVYGSGSTTNDQPQVTIRLVPEALIVGHVDVPGAEGEVRIQCQLYRRETREGRETWTPQRDFRTWADGEFRFSNLTAGTYKLITHEQVDRDSMQQGPDAQRFGYPPVYYQNTTDFSLATPIVVKAGETARVNLTVRRREYYPVRIAVVNMPAGLRLFPPTVYPTGHPSPGWSLGYNPGENAIDGILPDGNYTVQLSTLGQPGMTGILNFSVNGRSLEGPTLNLAPDSTVTVKVREEFQSGLSNFAAPETASDTPQPGGRHNSNVHVGLSPIDELNLFRMGAGYLEAEESHGQDLTIPNVRPGRYRVIVNSGMGYTASIQSGGKDLLQQPLVVGLGGSVAPIEVVLRDDGAEVDGTLEGESINPATIAAEAQTSRLNHLVYLLPVKEGEEPRNVPAWQATFRFEQVPPGDYLAVAFEQPPEDLPFGSVERMQSLSGKGQMIHLETAQKISLKLKLVDSEGE